MSLRAEAAAGMNPFCYHIQTWLTKGTIRVYWNDQDEQVLTASGHDGIPTALQEFYEDAGIDSPNEQGEWPYLPVYMACGEQHHNPSGILFCRDIESRKGALNQREA